MEVIRCKKCGWIGRDGEISVKDNEYSGATEECCPVCRNSNTLERDVVTGCSFSQKNLEDLWDLFGDIPINDEEKILESFLGFPAGTNRFDVWNWFDERYDKGVAVLCYGDACPDIPDGTEESGAVA